MRGVALIVMLLVGAGGFVFGVWACNVITNSKGPTGVAEVEALIGFLIGACGIGFAGVIAAIGELVDARRPPPVPKT